MKAMRDLQFARKFLANVLRCDAVQFYTSLENVAQDSQTPIWSRGPQSEAHQEEASIDEMVRAVEKLVETAVKEDADELIGSDGGPRSWTA